MMRIAIAGTNGFAQYVAHYLTETTPHSFVFLSRRPNNGLAAKGWQVVQTNYDTLDDLTYILTGVDVVISTISGPPQLSLIDAAVAANVRNFVPSEFRGSPFRRRPDDPLDNDRAAALQKLQNLASQHRMNFTIFTCGVFFERLAPGGLASSQIDVSGALGGEGDFFADLRKCQASLPTSVQAVVSEKSEADIHVCMTSSRDAARFVVASLDLRFWPSELKFRAQRLSLRELVKVCEKVRGMPFQIKVETMPTLSEAMSRARVTGDKRQEVRTSQHLYTLEGRYDFDDTNLENFIHCETFEEWLSNAWRATLASS